MASDEELAKMLQYDALHEAEQSTGKSYKDSELTNWIGIYNQWDNITKKDAELQARGDTTGCMKVSDYRRVIEGVGFRQVLEVPFQSKKEWNAGQQEHLYVFWHSDGVLLDFDTYQGNVNGGNFHYNWIPVDRQHRFEFTSSGHFKESTDGTLVWIGHHDCREAVLFHLGQLKANGRLLVPWIDAFGLYLWHFGDHEGKLDHYRDESARLAGITRKRLALLPADVRKACGLK